MKCKKVQELLLTDYTDNELSPKFRKIIESHLSQCKQCREFLASVNNSVITSFSTVEQLEPPETVWRRVKETLISVEKETFNDSPVSRPWLFHALFGIRKPVLITATVAALLIAGVVLFHDTNGNQQVLGDYLEEEVEFLAYLDVDEESNNDTGPDFGTSIEEFLL